MLSGNARTSALLANLAALATASAVHGQTKVVYVDDDAPLGGDGTSWGSAFCYLDDALLHIPSSGMLEVAIHIAGGVYTPRRDVIGGSETFTVRNYVASGMTFSLYGGFAGLNGAFPDKRDTALYTTVLSADLKQDDSEGKYTDNSNSLLEIWSSGGFVLDGLTFTGLHGTNTDVRALMVYRFGDPSPWQVYSAYDGVVRDCTFIGNHLTFGSRLVSTWNDTSHATVSFEGCTFKDNSSAWSEGVLLYAVNGKTALRRCSFQADETFRSAVALSNVFAALEVSDTEFVGVSRAFEQDLTVVTSAVTLFDRCLFLLNTKASSGMHGIATRYAVMRDSIVRNEAPSSDAATKLVRIRSWGYVSVEHCNIEGGVGAFSHPSSSEVRWHGGNITSDPAFMDIDGPDNNLFTWGDNDLRLSPSSPCIDAGRRISPVAGMLDLIGSPRFFDGNGDSVARVDMGPREYPSGCDVDFDGSGFVDTDDFDAFVRAFEAGC